MLRLAVRVARADAELVLAELLELAPSGVEEIERDDGTTEYAVYGAPGELPALPDLRAAAAGALVDVSTTEIADDWSERWRAFHRPLRIDDRLCVRPPWEPADPDARLDVVIDPGQAFGTGAHATTALCLELLLGHAERDAARGPCVDVGCGSGVLAIVARKLGYGPVIAVDNDPLAVAAAAENAARNDVELDVRRCDLRAQQVPDAELALANVLSGPLLRWADVQRRLAPVLILSGLLAEEADRVAEAYARRGHDERGRMWRAEWAALLLARPPADG